MVLRESKQLAYAVSVLLLSVSVCSLKGGDLHKYVWLLVFKMCVVIRVVNNQ